MKKMRTPGTEGTDEEEERKKKKKKKEEIVEMLCQGHSPVAACRSYGAACSKLISSIFFLSMFSLARSLFRSRSVSSRSRRRKSQCGEQKTFHSQSSVMAC